MYDWFRTFPLSHSVHRHHFSCGMALKSGQECKQLVAIVTQAAGSTVLAKQLLQHNFAVHVTLLGKVAAVMHACDGTDHAWNMSLRTKSIILESVQPSEVQIILDFMQVRYNELAGVHEMSADM